jgi:hypothetical protein
MSPDAHPSIHVTPLFFVVTLFVNRWDGKEVVFFFGFLYVAALDGVCVVASLCFCESEYDFLGADGAYLSVRVVFFRSLDSCVNGACVVLLSLI